MPTDRLRMMLFRRVSKDCPEPEASGWEYLHRAAGPYNTAWSMASTSTWSYGRSLVDHKSFMEKPLQNVQTARYISSINSSAQSATERSAPAAPSSPRRIRIFKKGFNRLGCRLRHCVIISNAQIRNDKGEVLFCTSQFRFLTSQASVSCPTQTCSKQPRLSDKRLPRIAHSLT